MGRFLQNYISLDTGGDKTTDGEVGESESRCGASLPRFATWSNEGPNLANRTFSGCSPISELRSFWPNHACGRSLESSRQDDCNGVGGEFGIVFARAVGSSEHLMLRTLHGPQSTCLIDLVHQNSKFFVVQDELRPACCLPLLPA